ncbi:signal peptide peptidase SppA [Bisgaardia hudsonensis]|uniref:signal peptide peptidase SppA n=1 Tax=Bisgaardia hudsonensis TaxID=109472 RepID=UPI00104B07DD|nr:signal peptide peptidase SppA [Bisgaardia hudsonensis]QLB13913.1 signal peptide peptidase SppA [Bisgaardia hudsonensis]
MLKVLKFFWRVINCIRNLVMNLVFLLFVMLLMTIFTLSSIGNNSIKSDVDLTQPNALLISLDGFLADNREEDFSWHTALRELNSPDAPTQISTFDVVYAIRKAIDDPMINGLVLDLNHFQGADIPALNYVGKAILDFKMAKKTVIAYSDYYSQKQYLLASYADEIYLNPNGQVSIEGMVIESVYFKSLLDKLKITPHVFRVGTYKAAVEPFLRDNMSDEAKENTQRWLNKMWQGYKNTISENRHISLSEVLPEADIYLNELKELKGDTTAYSIKRHLVTKLADRFTLQQDLIKQFGKNKIGEANLFPFEEYLAQYPDPMIGQTKSKIAVINVEGAIIDGESYESDVGGDTIARLLRQAYDNTDIKAVILRVNSPGGSAFASEIIRQEIDHLQEVGKPVVVSMGGMAASGGYWISSTADYIVADPMTITGSIGIFAIIPTYEQGLKEIGVTADSVDTTKLVNKSPMSALSKKTEDIFQQEIEFGYERFLDVVSRGRHLSKDAVDKLAQGQVWLGSEAYKYKLVDELGTFDEAISKATELVNNKGNKDIGELSVEWLTDTDDSLLGSLIKDVKKGGSSLIKTSLFDMIGLPKGYHQLKKQLGILTKLNDPKGQYLYCINCGEIN